MTTMDDSKRREHGMKVRRAVLGDEHVDRAVAATTDFNRGTPGAKYGLVLGFPAILAVC
jgi:hypothetical protein